MKYIGIDYGTHRIGLAVSDEAGTMSFPRKEIENTESAITEITQIIQADTIGGIVMGESKNLQGQENALAQEARSFGEKLASASNAQLFFEPEMFSTQEARRDPEGVRGHGAVDSKAATIILNSYLDRITFAQKQTPQITIDDLAKIEISVGTVVVAELVPDSQKLIRFEIDFGNKGVRQIVSGIQKYVSDPQTLIGKQLAFVTNLAPRKLAGLESNGMLFAVGEDESFAFLTPSAFVPPGTNAH